VILPKVKPLGLFAMSRFIVVCSYIVTYIYIYDMLIYIYLYLYLFLYLYMDIRWNPKGS
jgi:hypothetical protein